MNYTDWKNLPDRTTPLTAENLLNDINTTKEEIKNLKTEISKIVEYGSNENGEYIKFSNGIMICTKTKSFSTSIETQSGIIYYTEINNDESLPQSFVEDPIYDNITLSTSENWIMYINIVDRATKTKWHNRFYLTSNLTRHSFTAICKFIAIGRWK